MLDHHVRITRQSSPYVDPSQIIRNLRDAIDAYRVMLIVSDVEIRRETENIILMPVISNVFSPISLEIARSRISNQYLIINLNDH